MFDFDPDEWSFFIAAVIVAWAGIRAYLVPIFSVSLHGKVDLCRAILIVSPILGLGLSYVVIQRWSDSVVKGHFDYVLMFLVGEAAWQAVAVPVMGFLGISLRDDAIERDNFAAALTVAGGLLAVSIIFAFSNVGGGPTIWTTLLPAATSGLGLGVVCLMAELIGGTVADDITIGRDVASGIRMAGLLLGAALVLGRAAGGIGNPGTRHGPTLRFSAGPFCCWLWGWAFFIGWRGRRPSAREGL